MSIAYERNTSLAFDTGVIRDAAKEYGDAAKNLRSMASNLNALLSDLAESEWTTQAGKAFQDMADTNWEKNIGKYAALLDTLKDILLKAANEYDGLVENHVCVTKVNL